MRPIDADDIMKKVDADIECLKEKIEGKAPYTVGAQMMYIAKEVKETVKGYLDQTHTLDQEPVRYGEWVEEIEPNVITASGRQIHLWRCSSCGFTWANRHDVHHYFKHCPNCGAKMVGGKKDENA